jgi:acyl-CoA thioesterase-1
MENSTEHSVLVRRFALLMAPFAILVLLIVIFVNSAVSTQKAIQENERELAATTTVYEIPDAPSRRDANRKASTTIVAFGDSITAGYGLDLADAYPAVLERALQEAGYPVVVMNSGVSGDTTAGGLSRAGFVASQKPDIVIIALGGNDMLRGIDPASTKNNLAGIIETFQRAGAKVVLAGMRAPANLGEGYVMQFDAIYPALAREFDVPLVPFLLEGVALEKSLNQADGIHPNETGARVIAEEILLPKILPLLVKS